MTVQKKAYTAGHFELEIDGHKSTAYLRSVEGGSATASPIEEASGTHNQRIKSISVMDIEPFSIDMGISGARDIIKWIGDSWRKKYSRRSGVITHANFNLNRTYEHEFFDALITETTFPKLDGSLKEAAFLKVKVQPERVLERKVPAGSKIQPIGGLKQKLWSANAFRFSIDGLSGLEMVNRIESFSIKQGIKKSYNGEDRFPSVEPTKLEFPNIVGTVALEYADDLIKWKRDYIDKGLTETSAQKTAVLEFLGPNKKDTLFSVNLFEVGIHKLNILHSDANDDSIKRVKFELYVGRMEMDGAASGLD